MKISEKGLALIKEFEGLYLKAYQDSVGVWTIGWGITNSDKSITGTTIKKGLTISRATAEDWLRKSLDKKYAPKVMKYDDKYHWNQNQFDALVSFAFNIGSIDQLTAKGTRSIEQIASKMLEYSKAGDRFLNGLYRRRKAEHDLFCTPYVPVVSNKRLIEDLARYHEYIKAHYKKFINKYESFITTFTRVQDRIKNGQTVGITCVVPLRWALEEMGITRADGKALISGNNGSFKSHYTGNVKTHFDLITSGECIGITVKDAIDRNLLKRGDIICYVDHTHTSVYSGEGYDFYEGGSQCVKDGHYPKGIRVSYERYPYRISQILRFKDKYMVTEKGIDGKEDYDMPQVKKGSKNKTVRIWQIIIGVKSDGIFDDKTDAATRKFQEKHGLKVDGIVGSRTWGAGIATLPE